MEKTYERPIIDFPSFPENLRKIRKERGLTFRMLALICEATPANLCRYEQGVHMPRTKTLASICRALGVPLNELLGPFKVWDEAQQREWVGLTDEEVSEIIRKEIGFNSCFGPEESFARAIEAKLKEKNQ
ncbi:MAG: XRE family transcriptional regulator [Betaproteobacteria bacterium]|nr:XRE family transcriptional regulator [Betaproteobacteria bacterium]